MGKLITYTMILAAILVGFNLAGLIQDTPSQVILNFVKNPQSFQTTSLYLQIVSILTVLGGLGIIAGAALGDRVQWALTTGLALIFLSVGFDIVAIFNIVANTSLALAIFFVGVPFLGYMLTVVEWWTNKD